MSKAFDEWWEKDGVFTTTMRMKDVQNVAWNAALVHADVPALTTALARAIEEADVLFDHGYGGPSPSLDGERKLLALAIARDRNNT